MSAQYTVGQQLNDGVTVTADEYTENPDGSSVENVTTSTGATFSIYVGTPDEQAVTTATANLQSLVNQLAPSLAQAQTDVETLASSTDPLAPIISRTVQGVATVAQGLADALVALQVITASQIQQGSQSSPS